MWLAVALILAVVAGGVAFVTLQKASVTQAESPLPASTTSVVVAAHPMPVGTLLKDTDLTTQSLPSGSLPAGAITSLTDASGKLTTVALEAGEMVLAHHVTTPDITGTNLAFTLPQGLVGVTLGAGDLMSSVGVLKPGDKVDILYSLEVPTDAQLQAKATGGTTSAGNVNDKKQWTFGTLQSVTIVNVVYSPSKDSNQKASGSDAAAVLGPVNAYVLALPPQDALILKYLKDAGATMDLAIRNVSDETDHATDPVDVKYLIDKFQLRSR
jgi:pilus assembly protein CpaB